MSTPHRARPGLTILAALAGSLAWVGPYFMIPFLPRFPPLRFAPFQVRLAEAAIAFSIGAVIATGFFLLGLNLLSVKSNVTSRSHGRLRLAGSALIGSALGGLVGPSIGLVVGYSSWGRSWLVPLGSFQTDPEPHFSLGVALGVAIAASVFLLLSGSSTMRAPQPAAPAQSIPGVVLRLFLIAIAARALFCLVQFSSIVAYSPFGQTASFTLVNTAASGALFGGWAWSSAARRLWSVGRSSGPPQVA